MSGPEVESWRERAACKGLTAVMFPEEGESYAPAIAICRSCPVLSECREAGAKERHGCWGAEKPQQRGARRRDPSRVPEFCKAGHDLTVVGVYWFDYRWGCRACRDAAKRRWDKRKAS